MDHAGVSQTVTIIRPTGRPLAERAKEIEQKSREHLEPEELSALWKALRPDPFWFGYFRLQYHFGCRSSEVAILLKEDVDFKTGTIVIRRLKKRDVETGFHEHPYEMPEKLTTILKAVTPLVEKANPWFFGSPYKATKRAHAKSEKNTGRRMATIRITDGGWRAVSRSSAENAFKAACVLAKIPPNLSHTHVLRHTRGTLLFAQGAQLADVQYLLGHSDPKTTQIYVGWAGTLKRRAHLTALLGDED